MIAIARKTLSFGAIRRGFGSLTNSHGGDMTQDTNLMDMYCMMEDVGVLPGLVALG